jgi:DNA-binding LacI/PurR family transcriptional regulator
MVSLYSTNVNILQQKLNTSVELVATFYVNGCRLAVTARNLGVLLAMRLFASISAQRRRGKSTKLGISPKSRKIGCEWSQSAAIMALTTVAIGGECRIAMRLRCTRKNTRISISWAASGHHVTYIEYYQTMLSEKDTSPTQVFITLRERITSGLYAVGSRLPAERALAREFGVDRSLVRRALTQLDESNLIVRERGKRPSVFYSPPGLTQSISENSSRTNGTQTIVAILPHNPEFPAAQSVLHGIFGALRSTESSYRLQVIDIYGGNLQREIALEKHALESVLNENVAGVVLWHLAGVETIPILRLVQDRGIPIVFIDRYPAELICDFVGTDNQTAIEDVLDYLRQLGHTRIGYFTHDEDASTVIERRIAFENAVTTVVPTPTSNSIYSFPYKLLPDADGAFSYFFGAPTPPTAVVAMNDALAYHFISKCESQGKKIPDDISVVGFDDIEHHSPRAAFLTTVHQRFDKMGQRAAALLLYRLKSDNNKQAAKQHILLPAALIKRGSSGPPKVTGEEVSN